MRLQHGGFTPKVAGRPINDVAAVPLPDRLILNLVRNGIPYEPVVRQGEQVAFGDSIASAPFGAEQLILPAPASGRVAEVEPGSHVTLEGVVDTPVSGVLRPLAIERSSAAEIRASLLRGGVWPFLWSSRNRGIPPAEASAAPRSIIVNFILTEPFRARGRVVIERSWQRIMTGITFLQRLVADYGTIEIVLTDKNHPVARMMYEDLKGQAYVRFHSVPLTYPIENPRVLTNLLRAKSREIKKDDELWVIDAQGIEAAGGCLGEGLPLHERVVVTGGPSEQDPRHHAVRIGTPLDRFVSPKGEGTLLLRGGLLNGVPVSQDIAAVGYEDDAYFALPRAGKQELLAFARPGIRKTSFTRSFAGDLFGVYDRTVSATLRGEERPCVACGFCETVCPAGIMPQIIHRYLYREKTEEAEKAGLDRCVDCNLCTYVCPSKIDLGRQFREGREIIRQEREEMRAVAEKSETSLEGAEE